MFTLLPHTSCYTGYRNTKEGPLWTDNWRKSRKAQLLHSCSLQLSWCLPDWPDNIPLPQRPASWTSSTTGRTGPPISAAGIRLSSIMTAPPLPHLRKTAKQSEPPGIVCAGKTNRHLNDRHDTPSIQRKSWRFLCSLSNTGLVSKASTFAGHERHRSRHFRFSFTAKKAEPGLMQTKNKVTLFCCFYLTVHSFQDLPGQISKWNRQRVLRTKVSAGPWLLLQIKKDSPFGKSFCILMAGVLGHNAKDSI